jgi:hypothetical protein
MLLTFLFELVCIAELGRSTVRQSDFDKVAIFSCYFYDDHVFGRSTSFLRK